MTKTISKTTSKTTSKMLAKKIAKIADDHQATDIVILDLKKLTSFTDCFVIMTGGSDRQVRALSDAIDEELREKGIKYLSEEGLTTNHWILMDYGDVVVHIFYPTEREHYGLEKLWYDAPRI